MRTLMLLALSLTAAGLPISNSLAQQSAEDIRKIVREEIKRAIAELHGIATEKSDAAPRKHLELSKTVLENARKKLESIRGKLHVIGGDPDKIEVLHGDHDGAIVLRTGDGDEPHVLRLGGKGRILELLGGGHDGAIVLHTGDGDEPHVLQFSGKGKGTELKWEVGGDHARRIVLRTSDKDGPHVLHFGGKGEGKVLELKGSDKHEMNVRVEKTDGKTRVWVNGEEVDADDFEGFGNIKLPKLETLHLDAIKGLKLDGARVLRLRKHDDDDDDDGKHRVRRVIRIGDGNKTIVGLPGQFSTDFHFGPIGVSKDHTVLFSPKGKAGSGASPNMFFGTPGHTFNVFRASGDDGNRECCCCCGTTTSQCVMVVAPSAPAKSKKQAAKQKKVRKVKVQKVKGRIMV